MGAPLFWDYGVGFAAINSSNMVGEGRRGQGGDRRGEIPCNKKDQHWESCSSCWSVAPIWRDNVRVVGKVSWGRICGCAKLLAGTLRCLRLCWARLAKWSPEEQLGRCPKPHKGRCPLTLQGALPLDPFLAVRLERTSQTELFCCFFLISYPVQTCSAGSASP